jgi:hypothetical protein
MYLKSQSLKKLKKLKSLKKLKKLKSLKKLKKLKSSKKLKKLKSSKKLKKLKSSKKLKKLKSSKKLKKLKSSKKLKKLKSSKKLKKLKSSKKLKKSQMQYGGFGPLENHFSPDGDFFNMGKQIANLVVNIGAGIASSVSLAYNLTRLPGDFVSIVNKPNEPLPANNPVSKFIDII